MSRKREPGEPVTVRLLRDNWGHLEWSVLPEEWDGQEVWWVLPSGHREPARVQCRYTTREVQDHGHAEHVRTWVVGLSLGDGTWIDCEVRPQNAVTR